jgi:type II secretory pathway component GspD/PulD (secretin)
MKTTLPLLFVALTLVAADPEPRRKPASKPETESAGKTEAGFTSLDRPSERHARQGTGLLNFEDVDLLQVFKMYQSLSGRTVVRSTTLPQTKISLQSEGPVSTLKALQMLDTVLAQNNIVMIPQGADVVKAVAAQAAPIEAVPICELTPQELPESQSYTCYIVRLKDRRPRDVAQALQPFARLPNSILGIDDSGLLVLRDYAVNVKRMLQVLERIEQNPPLKLEDDRRKWPQPGFAPAPTVPPPQPQ